MNGGAPGSAPPFYTGGAYDSLPQTTTADAEHIGGGPAPIGSYSSSMAPAFVSPAHHGSSMAYQGGASYQRGAAQMMPPLADEQAAKRMRMTMMMMMGQSPPQSSSDWSTAPSWRAPSPTSLPEEDGWITRVSTQQERQSRLYEYSQQHQEYQEQQQHLHHQEQQQHLHHHQEQHQQHQHQQLQLQQHQPQHQQEPQMYFAPSVASPQQATHPSAYGAYAAPVSAPSWRASLPLSLPEEGGWITRVATERERSANVAAYKRMVPKIPKKRKKKRVSELGGEFDDDDDDDDDESFLDDGTSEDAGAGQHHPESTSLGRSRSQLDALVARRANQAEAGIRFARGARRAEAYPPPPPPPFHNYAAAYSPNGLTCAIPGGRGSPYYGPPPPVGAIAVAPRRQPKAPRQHVSNNDEDNDDDEELHVPMGKALTAEDTLALCGKFSERLVREFCRSIAAGDGASAAADGGSISFACMGEADREGGAGSFVAATEAEVKGVCSVTLELREHQLVGVNWLLLLERVGANGVLADDMGLGKTVQTIAYLAVSRARRLKAAPAAAAAAGGGGGGGGGGATAMTTTTTTPGAVRKKATNGMDVVVVPASTLANWGAEFERFAPGTRVVVYHGTQAERAAVRAAFQAGACDVVLTTYTWWERDGCGDDRAFFTQRSPWAHVVLDEGHSLKNPRASRTRRLKALRSEGRTILSGTPIQNDPMDVLSLLSYLMPQLFADTDGLLALAAELKGSADQGGFDRLRKLLAPFVLRRVKAQVLAQLPPKDTRVVPITLGEAQREVYYQVTAKHVAQRDRAFEKFQRKPASTEGAVVASSRKRTAAVEEEGPYCCASTSSPRPLAGGGSLGRWDEAGAKNLFTELRKAANHPLLLRVKYDGEAVDRIASALRAKGHFGKSATAAMIKAELDGYSDFDLHELCVTYPDPLGDLSLKVDALFSSAKFERLRDLLPALCSCPPRGGAKHRVLLFSQWVRLLDLLGLLCQSLGLKTCRLDGSTPVSERQDLVTRFNAEDSDLDVFLLSTRAGGLGLNLTGADTVVIHDVDFNPEVDRQAEDRAHRIGQSRPVMVYKLVAQDTVDADILSIAQRKRDVNDQVLDEETNDANDNTTTKGGNNNKNNNTKGADGPSRSAVADAIAKAVREFQNRDGKKKNSDGASKPVETAA